VPRAATDIHDAAYRFGTGAEQSFDCRKGSKTTMDENEIPVKNIEDWTGHIG
jgi:hypothetical protein